MTPRFLAGPPSPGGTTYLQAPGGWLCPGVLSGCSQPCGPCHCCCGLLILKVKVLEIETAFLSSTACLLQIYSHLALHNVASIMSFANTFRNPAEILSWFMCVSAQLRRE